MCKSYNGYTNYETWNVALWIDNDQGEQEYWIERAQNADSKHDLAMEMCDAYNERLDEMHIDASCFSDLLGAALSSVNWDEIAENMWDEYHEAEEPEEATA